MEDREKRESAKLNLVKRCSHVDGSKARGKPTKAFGREKTACVALKGKKRIRQQRNSRKGAESGRGHSQRCPLTRHFL